MKYFLKQMILDPTIAISINLEMFTRLKTSLNTLHAAKAVEETYDLLIQNYLEFEQELLTILARQMIIEEESYDDLYTIIISRLNRRVVNLLTSTKLYYDHIEKHVRICMEDDDEGKIAKKFFSTEYDKHLEYRFMDAMRNYVQHYGLAVHSISLQRNWEESNNHKQLVYKIQMYTWKDELSKDKTFKKKVLLEISDKVDLLKSIRVYISSLSSVHQQVRSQIKDTVIQARLNIVEAISMYEKENNGDALSCYAYSVSDSDPMEKPIEKYALMLDWDDVRVKLENKNKIMPTLVNWHVSGSCF